MKIGYARVSTPRQDGSLETQRDALLAAGCDPKHLYGDQVSGTTWSRPELDRTLAYMREGDTLVVTRLDRLGRNMREAVSTIAYLGERGMNVKCLDPELDTSRPQDRVVTHIMLAFAEWERDLLAAKTREGVEHAKAEGRVAGPKP